MPTRRSDSDLILRCCGSFDGQLIKPRPVIEALDLAMETLFPYTDFHQASFDLFLRLTDGKLTFEEEQMLNALGVKF